MESAARRPATELAVIPRTAAINKDEDALSLALVALIGGIRPPISPDEVRGQLVDHYHILPDAFTVARYAPEDFLVVFRSREDSELLALRYRVTIRIVELQDWRALPSSSDDSPPDDSNDPGWFLRANRCRSAPWPRRFSPNDDGSVDGDATAPLRALGASFVGTARRCLGNRCHHLRKLWPSNSCPLAAIRGKVSIPLCFATAQ